jgi:hypothetical protein
VLPLRSRALMIPALRRAIGDAQAMQRLRRNYNQLLNTTIARGSTSLSEQELIAEYTYAARRGWLTVIFGHIESTNSDRPPGTVVNDLFEGHPVLENLKLKIGKPQVDPRSDVPGPEVLIPRLFEERLTWVVSRAPRYMTEEAQIRFREFFTVDGLKTTVAILALWSLSHVVGVGFVVDAALFGAAVWQLGSAALLAFEHLKKFFDLTRNPGSWGDLDEAAQLFASAMFTFGVPLMRQMLRRIGSTTGTQGSMIDYERSPAKIGTPARKKTEAAKPKAAEPTPSSGGGDGGALVVPGRTSGSGGGGRQSGGGGSGGGQTTAGAAADIAALVAGRKKRAREFYRSQGMRESEIDAHLAGIDFTKEVEVVSIKAGEIVEQWQVPGGKQGRYFAPPGATPSELGVSPVGYDYEKSQTLAKQMVKYRVEKEIQVLRSTAAPVEDFWSHPAARAMTKGGGTQYFVDDPSAFTPL